MKDASEDRLLSVLAATAKSLEASLSKFWPAQGNNDMAEANLLTHAGAALLKHDFSVFAEVAFEPRDLGGGESGRLDLLAVAENWMVMVEAKRVYNFDTVMSLVSDWQRMKTHQPTTGYDNPRAKVLSRCVLATTWKESIASQWQQSTSSDWIELRMCLGEDGVRIFHHVLQRDRSWGRQYLLAAFSDAT